MSSFSDEPVLVKPDRKSAWKFRLMIGVAVLIAGAAIYIPWDKARMEELAHEAERGSRQGTLVRLTIDGLPHTLELTWMRGRFAPVLDPAPAAGTTLTLKSRRGSGVLNWDAEKKCFGPVDFEVDPYSHYKLDLKLERDGRELWSDTAWAYGIHDSHGHAH